MQVNARLFCEVVTVLLPVDAPYVKESEALFMLPLCCRLPMSHP